MEPKTALRGGNALKIFLTRIFVVFILLSFKSHMNKPRVHVKYIIFKTINLFIYWREDISLCA